MILAWQNSTDRGDSMATFIFTWKPAQWDWADLEECVAHIEAGKEIAVEWSTGRRKTMVIGDNFYLLRQANEPLGIFGQGIVASLPLLRDSYEDKNKEEYRIQLRIKALINPYVTQPFDIRELPHPFNKLWNSRETGDRVDPMGTEKLRGLWQVYWPTRQPHGLEVPRKLTETSRKKLIKVF